MFFTIVVRLHTCFIIKKSYTYYLDSDAYHHVQRNYVSRCSASFKNSLDLCTFEISCCFFLRPVESPLRTFFYFRIPFSLAFEQTTAEVTTVFLTGGGEGLDEFEEDEQRILLFGPLCWKSFMWFVDELRVVKMVLSGLAVVSSKSSSSSSLKPLTVLSVEMSLMGLSGAAPRRGLLEPAPRTPP